MIVKRIICLFVAFFASMALFACGGAEDDILRIALDIEDEGRYDELFTYFTETTGISVRATYGLDPVKIINTKDEPDIIKTSTVAIRSMKDIFVDLSPYLDADPDIDVSDYREVLIDALTFDGKVYALPTAVNTSLLYYNKTLFDGKEDELRSAFGLSSDESVYPRADWTWDDFRTAGVILSQYTGSGDDRTYTRFGAEAQLGWWGEWLVYLQQMGGTFYVPETEDHICALDSAAAFAATTFYRSKSMGSATEKFAPDAVEQSSGFSFLAGNVAMIFGGHLGDWYAYDLLDMDWGVQLLPTPVGRPDARGGEISADAFGISVRSEKKEQAFTFLKIWAGEEGAVEMYKYGKIGARNDMESLIDALPETERASIDHTIVFDAMEIAVTLPAEKDFAKVMRDMVMTELYLLMYEGRGSETDVAAVLSRIKTHVDDYYDGLYD
ncbi:MAG: extracellular solute-binding protein [Candidatus Izemoplasmatales bacterium]